MRARRTSVTLHLFLLDATQVLAVVFLALLGSDQYYNMPTTRQATSKGARNLKSPGKLGGKSKSPASRAGGNQRRATAAPNSQTPDGIGAAGLYCRPDYLLRLYVPRADADLRDDVAALLVVGSHPD